ncbi:MAG: hypothetical protein ABJH07_18570 [Sedimentitalea sp.]|uniref:hypothetical protein n=1 Tax=Sedimentitalea sp. TaxID=2048915 RepID=UPI003263EB8D
MEETETNTIATAFRMLDRFGDAAPHQVGLRIVELRERGEMEAAAYWLRVHRLVAELLEDGPKRSRQ